MVLSCLEMGWEVSRVYVFGRCVQRRLDRAYGPFAAGEEGIGVWSDRVRDSGYGVREVRCRGSGFECERVSFAPVCSETVHDLGLRDDWHGGKRLRRLVLILSSPPKAWGPESLGRVTVLNQSSLTPGLYLLLKHTPWQL